MDVRQAWETAKRTIAEHAGEIKRATSAGAMPTLTRTQAQRLVMEPTPVPMKDTELTRRKIQQAQALLLDTRAKLCRKAV